MKKIAIIKNELFKDYLKIVSTENLEKVLDTGDVPIPYECILSISNNYADELVEEFSNHFKEEKLKNKDFYKLSESQKEQLMFLMKIVKISGGNAKIEEKLENQVKQLDVNEVKEKIEVFKNQEKVEKSNSIEKVKENIMNIDVLNHIQEEKPSQTIQSFISSVQIQEEKAKEEKVFKKPTIEKYVKHQEIPYDDGFEYIHAELEENGGDYLTGNVFYNNDKNEVLIRGVNGIEEDDFDPFKAVPEEELYDENSEENQAIKENGTDLKEIIKSFEIEKGAELSFNKDEKIKAKLIGEEQIEFDGQICNFIEAAKMAYKKSGSFGIPIGMGNWLYEGKSLKVWKEESQRKQ